MTGERPTSVLNRLVAATNAHDIDALVGCFADDYVNETPVHPARGFTGSEQVRANWTQIFAAVPDIHAEVLNRAEDGDAVWSEWEMSGTLGNGSPHVMRGVILFRMTGSHIAHARFYLEPLDAASGDVAAAVRTLTSSGT